MYRHILSHTNGMNLLCEDCWRTSWREDVIKTLSSFRERLKYYRNSDFVILTLNLFRHYFR